MNEETKKIIKERFDALPEGIQEILLSSDYEETLVEISKKYNLTVGQMTSLEIETTMVMLALAPQKDFEPSITRELGIDHVKAAQIIQDIHEKIFLKIRDLLKLMNTPEGEEPDLGEERMAVPEGKSPSDAGVLKSAGIEIVTAAEKPKEATVPVFAQKLSTPSQSTPVQTVHTELPKEPGTPSPATPAPNSKKYDVDPYRELPQ